ncbi:hypothetical protein DTO164E3_1409 [Paecilomyces variotii]|nr:hypothetical protein DTO164E3_1409 [Paecilomyces variotii]KAJ9312789.1 hypothetical protein DTO271D3_7023 [Paecilomyces variotii]KAJ9354610.1 hypothetical protein DTO027B9_4646 [Paecilomyces variotii]
MSKPSEDAKIEGFFIPDDLDELAELLKATGLKKLTPYSLREKWLGSGSKVSQKQFASFRAIWPQMKSSDELTKKDAHLYGIDKFWEDAQDIATNFRGLQKFLAMIESDTSLKDIDADDDRYPSAFTAVRDLHELIGFDRPHRRKSSRLKRAADATQSASSYTTRVTKKAKSKAPARARDIFSPRTSEDGGVRLSTEQGTSSYITDQDFEAQDEATVNAAAVLLLRLCSGAVKESKFEFLFERLVFRPKFGKNGFTTCTDGAFRSSQFILAILEAKKKSRHYDTISIQVQETAEMVGFLMELERKKGFMNDHPVIISQDHNQLYITFASFHKDYLNYLKNEDAAITDNTYLCLQSYGPFHTNGTAAREEKVLYVNSLQLLRPPRYICDISLGLVRSYSATTKRFKYHRDGGL